MRRLVLGLLLAAASVSTIACTQTATGAGPSASSSSGSTPPPSGTTAADQPLTCIGILACAKDCTDNACADACVAKGSPEGQASVTKLAQCYQDNQCQDGTCAQAKCKAELDACQTQSAPPPAGQPASGDAPAGNVPAALVGRWTYTSPGGTNTELDFNADGTGRYAEIQQSEGTCTMTSILQYEGNVVADDASITIYGTNASLQQTSCGSKSSIPQSGRTIQYGYKLGSDESGPTLLITDQDCIAKNGDASYCYSNYSKS